jgi:hypothetical protein
MNGIDANACLGLLDNIQPTPNPFLPYQPHLQPLPLFYFSVQPLCPLIFWGLMRTFWG